MKILKEWPVTVSTVKTTEQHVKLLQRRKITPAKRK
jgi:hypothetical protein